jgi:hypothetical protein
MEYPEVLLPSIHFKKIETDLSGHFISRTTPIQDILNPETGKLKGEALCDDPLEFFDYSTNLIGHFRKEHNYITLCGDEKKHFRDHWDFKAVVKIPVYEKDFLFNEEKGVFYLPINKIHEKIRFPKNINNNKSDYIVATVVHVPSFSNFWHFCIKWHDNDGNIISSNKSTWKNAIISSIRATILELFELSDPEINLIAKEDYIKSENT